MGNKSNLPEEIKDAVVRDYLRGDKGIVIQLEYKISPGPMYRILRERKVPLRSKGNEPPAPAEAEADVGLYCEPCDQSFSTPPGKASHERSLAHRVRVAVDREGGFLPAVQALVDEDVPAAVTLKRVNDLLEVWFAKDSVATLKDIGLWEKATDEGITPTEIVNAAVETFVGLCFRSMPEAEEIEPGVFRWREVPAT